MPKFDDSQPPISSTQLDGIKNKLLKKKQGLLDELKSKHAWIYNWLVEHNIDLNNLQKYSKNIAAALALANQLVSAQPLIIPVPTPPVATDKNAPDSNGVLSDSENAKNTWNKYGAIIDKVAEKYAVDPQLIFATIMTESEGNQFAYRYERHLDDASYGLGQILYSTAVLLGFSGKPEDMYRPEINIDLVGKYHRNTLDTYGELSPEQMTVVYNTGVLFGYPTYGHLSRFREWYYTYKKEGVKLV